MLFFHGNTISSFFLFVKCAMKVKILLLHVELHISAYAVYSDKIYLTRTFFFHVFFFFPNCLFIQLFIKYASAYCLLSMAKFMHEIPLQIIFSLFTLTQFYLNQILSSHKATSVFFNLALITRFCPLLPNLIQAP